LNDRSVELQKVTGLAAGAAALWTLSGAAYLFETFLTVTGVQVSTDNTFSQQLWLFVTQIQLGQYLFFNLIAAALLTVAALLVRTLTGTAIVAALGLVALVPLALTGHAAGSASHAMAVNAIGIHILGAAVWAGGLVAVYALRGRITGDALVGEKTVINRYSSLALWAFIAVAVSGIASAQLRIVEFKNLTTPYGALAIFKVAILVALGIIGAVHRRFAIKHLVNRANMFYRLVAVEFVLFGAAIGLGTALSRTAAPVNDYPLGKLSPAEILTGAQLPPELTPIRYLTSFSIDLIWLGVALAGIVAYVAGALRLKRRGDKWPIGRTISWVAGMLLLAYITNGAFNVYEQYLFSDHMLAHMLLTMGVPVLLVPGAPVTLLARAVEKRQDDSRGVREWVLWAVHTKYAQLIAHPLVAATLFASSLVVFYFTPVFGWATRDHIGHEWMILHFVITGYLFVQALVGIDPGPKRFGYPQRLMLLIGTLTFHAFFGLALMTGSTLLLADWYGAMGRTWGQNPLADQQTGGAIAWGIGELPTAALVMITAWQWARSDRREAVRLDRASDRSGNEDLSEYNRMLERLAKRESKD
jgi:putative copper resistance protein D